MLDSILNFNYLEVIATSSYSFLLIFAAEIGDKSQLVCMTLAARYRGAPVILGSVLAFLLLNTIAVTFGVEIAEWLPEVFVTVVVAILFGSFGVHALRIKESLGNEEITMKSNGSILLGTFLLILVAEFGDKTQLAVVALSSTSLPFAVWLGSTAALITTSALGVWAGRTILQKIPLTFLHKLSGVVFIVLSLIAAYKVYMSL